MIPSLSNDFIISSSLTTCSARIFSFLPTSNVFIVVETPTISSLTSISFNVTFPVFVTVIVYLIVSPTSALSDLFSLYLTISELFSIEKLGTHISSPLLAVIACRLIGIQVISSVFQGFSTTVVCVYSVSGTVVPAFPVVVPVVVPWLVVVPGFVVVSPFWAGVVGFWLSSIIGICSGLSVFGVFGFSTPPLLFESFPLLAGSVTSVFSIAAAALLLPLI